MLIKQDMQQKRPLAHVSGPVEGEQQADQRRQLSGCQRQAIHPLAYQLCCAAEISQKGLKEDNSMPQN